MCEERRDGAMLQKNKEKIRSTKNNVENKNVNLMITHVVHPNKQEANPIEFTSEPRARK
jgi:hypothetical protein